MIAVPVSATADGPLHRLDARAKLIALLGLVLIAVSVPSPEHARLGLLAALLAALALISGVPARAFLRRFLHLAPFLAVAALLPFTRPGSLDRAIGDAAKAVYGCAAVVLLGATTPVDRLLGGLRGLRCPALVVMLLGILIRYLDLLRDEAARLRRAAIARGFTARNLRQSGVIGRLVGTLFLRSHARAERVHAAMLARGFTGEAIGPPAPPASLVDWACVAGILGLGLLIRLA